VKDVNIAPAFKAMLIAVLLVVGIGIGLLIGLAWHNLNIDLSPQQKEAATNAADLQKQIIQELQTRYYRPVNADKLGTAAIDGMLKSLKDPYTVYLDPQEAALLRERTEGRYSGIGATLQQTKDGAIVITGVFPGSPAQKAGLRPGDRILAVDGKPTKDRSLDTNIAHIKGKEGSQVKITYQKKGEQARRDVYLTRRQITIPITRQRMLTAPDGTKVGYVELSQFAQDASVALRKAIDSDEVKGAKWIVFDLRYNGGGLVDEAVNVSSLFIAEGPIVSTQGLHSPKEVLTATGDVATDLPLVVLVNGFTASASEITAGAIQDYERGTVIGTKTFGKGLVQQIIAMPQGAALKLTIAVYLTPDGRNINKRGIQPNVVVKDQPKQEGDEQLDAALEYISRQ
jgi:carboxyl-terminal processing protease